MLGSPKAPTWSSDEAHHDGAAEDAGGGLHGADHAHHPHDGHDHQGVEQPRHERVRRQRAQQFEVEHAPLERQHERRGQQRPSAHEHERGAPGPEAPADDAVERGDEAVDGAERGDGDHGERQGHHASPHRSRTCQR
jgi:hypothetical protein